MKSKSRQCHSSYYLKVIIIALILPLIAGCGLPSNGIPPTEEEQIKVVVEDYFRRDANVPEYNVTIEAVVNNWARVSITPVGVEATDNDPVLYLQNQSEAEEPVPTADLDLSQPGNDADVMTDLGWAIITKPQATFTDQELDQAMVPEEIRR